MSDRDRRCKRSLHGTDGARVCRLHLPHRLHTRQARSCGRISSGCPDGERLHLIYHLNYEQVFIITTEDLGETWTDPREITEGYRQPEYDWNVCATGPGRE